MIDLNTLGLFLVAATVLAVTPGPGIMFVLARSLAEGTEVGVRSTLGTGIGGLIQVAAGAVGLSGAMLASAEAFTVIKVLGAVYLVWLGIQMIGAAGKDLAPTISGEQGLGRAFRDGVVVEVLNPKTALFLLAFIPQFVDPARGDVALQFVIFGVIAVALNTGVDLIVARTAGSLQRSAVTNASLISMLRRGAGVTMCGLGVLLLFARRPA